LKKDTKHYSKPSRRINHSKFSQNRPFFG